MGVDHNPSYPLRQLVLFLSSFSKLFDRWSFCLGLFCFGLFVLYFCHTYFNLASFVAISYNEGSLSL